MGFRNFRVWGFRNFRGLGVSVVFRAWVSGAPGLGLRGFLGVEEFGQASVEGSCW